MKRTLLLTGCIVISALSLQAQVTRINNNNSLQVVYPFNATKAIVVSNIDSSIWTTDASLAGTVPVVTSVKYEGFGQMLSGKFIFRGSTPATGSEVYAYDGTTVSLVSDINLGPVGSEPGVMALLNGFLYFAATRPAEGRELWRTNGTTGGTTLVKDIDGAATSSFPTSLLGLTEEIFSNGTYLLFAARTPGSGNELWRSDGSTGGTVLLKEINTGNSNADSSNPRFFYPYNNLALFVATDNTAGEEVWRSDGTPGGTFRLADINPGTASSTQLELFPGFSFNIFLGFHVFNNHAYFQANNGVSTGTLWSTDGSVANTVLIKDIVSGTSLSFIFVIDAVNLPGKFIFPVSDGVGASRSELWQSDGTPVGTVPFKSFTPVVEGDIPIIFVPYNADFLSSNFTNPLFQGNKFFFAARTPTDGNELWVSDGVDGTVAHTHVVKNINGAGDGVGGVDMDDNTNNTSYLYTNNTFFFAANEDASGDELWKTDGTDAATSIVQDIHLNAPDADPSLSIIFNNKIIFTATDGDDPDHRDLFTVDGNFTPLPLKLIDFTVSPKNNDAILQWSTAQELNTKNFTIQRSYDAQHFDDIGTVLAMGTSNSRHGYTFSDAGIINSGKDIIYYRLVAADIDGKSVNTNVISLKVRGNNSQWNVHLLSNPVQDNVNIMVSGVNGAIRFSIVDMTGKRMYSKSLNNVNGQISLPVTLQKGVYILEAKTNNESKSFRFVK